MTLSELLYYHASEGGLLNGDIAREIASEYGIKTDEIDFEQWAETANGRAIEDTLQGKILGARLFKTQYLTLAEMACGTITNGNLEWDSEPAFVAAMQDHGIPYTVISVV